MQQYERHPEYFGKLCCKGPSTVQCPEGLVSGFLCFDDQQRIVRALRRVHPPGQPMQIRESPLGFAWMPLFLKDLKSWYLSAG